MKHFKWEPTGKRRLHKKPNAREIAACRPWLEAELAVLRPKLVVTLGATAAQTLRGKNFLITRERGKLLDSPWSEKFLATIHPSAILRSPDGQRAVEQERLVEDLRVAADWLRSRL